MIRRIAGLAGSLCFALLLWGACAAQDGSYKEQIDKIVEEAGKLTPSLQANTLDFANYDKWHKDFKDLADLFIKSFVKTHKSGESFTLMQRGIDGFSLAWSMLNQAKYADIQYKESLVLDAVSDAHKWKNSAVEKKKKAIDTITQAIEDLKSAREAQEGEGQRQT